MYPSVFMKRRLTMPETKESLLPTLNLSWACAMVN
jgi:hypothetical protein